jgi:hypothetical protein
MAIAGESEISTSRPNAEAMFCIPLGAASPLWVLFAGAAMSGAAWWWMSQWARPANLEAMFGRTAKLVETTEAEIEGQAVRLTDAVTATPPTLQATDEETKAVAEKAFEAPAAFVEAAAKAAAPIEVAATERLEGIADMTPIGGEAAPISPVLEAVAPKAPEVETPDVETPNVEAVVTPKPKKKPTEPKAG